MDVTNKEIDWAVLAQSESVGLEMQAPWAEELLSGRKTIETRTYPLPESLIDKKIWIIESKEGTAGKSSVADHVPRGSKDL